MLDALVSIMLYSLLLHLKKKKNTALKNKKKNYGVVAP